MLEIWQGLSEAQSSLLQTALIIVAGGIGVLLSAILFGRRVRNLETALEATEKKMSDAMQRSQSVIKEINSLVAEKLGTMDDQLSATLTVLTELRSGVSELQDTSEQNISALRDELRGYWLVVNEHLEALAANPEIHGRTRARYSRIPRRNMQLLIDALCGDGYMDRRESDFRTAVALWNKKRHPRATLEAADIERMKELAQRIALGPSFLHHR